MAESKLTHLDTEGRATMVDVSSKPMVRRTAIAEGFFVASPDALDRLESGDLPKGEALGTARIAGIQAAKDCSRMIPLCHPMPIDHVQVDIERSEPNRMRMEAQVSVTARTGVEMEALSAVTGCALTLYDMTKAIERHATIEGIRLVSKHKEEA
ncbi:MAG: cyclic pyranopterin monophosphate synthase MoaC [Phycisphaerales bacterium]|nr:cyclic pyranopterin monophosphate synthase MoaC [Phycisphaerales bacterium]